MDTGDIIILVTCLVGGAISVGALVFYFIFQYPKDKEKERLRRQKVEEEYEKEPEYAFSLARVLSKSHTVFYQTELRMPTLPAEKHERFVKFLKEDGSEEEYPVRQEIFDRIEEGQEGTLVTVNGNFFDFGDGEEIEETEDSEVFEQETEE